ncbi:hypothetical protein LX32DRAFT_298542 [Colletotrichum zoysiae]|uniref:Uncharacterized protein n=1 Tax=Colletotrichum zoysiae TaxID=1216348 RepID=A0AAD9H250_9PEZI|nr:hypothetical protein LX32DRAFT_298542 [Colletotrichum zoysiae]
MQERNRPGDGPDLPGLGWAWASTYLQYGYRVRIHSSHTLCFLPFAPDVLCFYFTDISSSSLTGPSARQRNEFPHTITIDAVSPPGYRLSVAFIRSVAWHTDTAVCTSASGCPSAPLPPVHQPWKRPWPPRPTALPTKSP